MQPDVHNEVTANMTKAHGLRCGAVSFVEVPSLAGKASRNKLAVEDDHMLALPQHHDQPARYFRYSDFLTSARSPDARAKLMYTSFVGEEGSQGADPSADAQNCQQDFGAECPIDWTPKEGVCTRDTEVPLVSASIPNSKDGKCAPLADLRGLSAAEKKAFAQQCNVRFPCLQPPSAAMRRCNPTSAPCPVGWRVEGDESTTLCVAPEGPNGYQGSCRPVVNAEEVAKMGKDKFSETCAVQFEHNCTSPPPPPLPAYAEPDFRNGPVNQHGLVVSG